MYTIYVVVTLTCLVGEERARAALAEGSTLQTTDVCDTVSPSLLEDCVSINSVKELFTPAAWHQVKQTIDVCDTVSPSLLEDCVSINSVKELFTPAAWHQVKQTTDVCDTVSPSLLEDCVSINSIKELFTPAAWHQVKQMLVALKKNPLWHCGTCHEEIEEEGDNRVFCDRCLSWLHYRCTKPKMTKPPASTYWFCCKCKT